MPNKRIYTKQGEEFAIFPMVVSILATIFMSVKVAPALLHENEVDVLFAVLTIALFLSLTVESVRRYVIAAS